MGRHPCSEADRTERDTTMTTVAYEVIVSVDADTVKQESAAIAEASRYLASDDLTGTFSDDASVFEAHAYDGPDAGWSDDEVLDWGIGLHFSVPVSDEQDKRLFEQQLDKLEYVGSWQEIPVVFDES